MPSIVIVNNEGKVIYQDSIENVGGLVRRIQDEGDLPNTLGPGATAESDGVIIITRQSPNPKRKPPKLTEKQAQVLRSLASSLSPGQTALKMGLSEESVRSYIKILKRKFNADSRDQLMAMAGYLQLCDPYKDKA